LFEVVLIQVLRHLMEQEQVSRGMLAGLLRPRRRKALAMHEQPAQEQTLDALASISGMLRTVFANGFRSVVGCTPGAYLQGW
jgi:AraC-like DNA-binding protein